MKKSSFETSFAYFYECMQWDIDLLIKIRKDKRVVKSREEKQSVFEAFVHSICSNWDILVEQLLIDCLNKDTSQFTQEYGYKLGKHITRDTCEAVLIGVGYLDFKSVRDLKGRSKRILMPKYNPFAEIPKSNEKKIGEFYTIRNYLAHYSDSAKRTLSKVYETNYNLKVFVRPGRFLLATEEDGELPRMGTYINNFMGAAAAMYKFLAVAHR